MSNNQELPKRVVDACSFCGCDVGTSQEHDGKGTPFYCCGSCWARVLHGGIVPDDITPIIQHMRKVNNNEQ